MSSKRLDKISDYARHGYAITVQCRGCGHSAKLDARAISDEASLDRKPKDSLLVSLADKTHNARAILDDLVVHGHALRDPTAELSRSAVNCVHGIELTPSRSERTH